MESKIVLKNQARGTCNRKTTEIPEALQTVTFALHAEVLSILQETVQITNTKIHHTHNAPLAG